MRNTVCGAFGRCLKDGKSYCQRKAIKDRFPSSEEFSPMSIPSLFRFLFCALPILISFSLSAQQSDQEQVGQDQATQQRIEHKAGAWFGTMTHQKMGASSALWAETQARYGVGSEGLTQILYRVGWLYQVTEKMGLGFLYAFIQGGGNKEHRWTFQHTQGYGSLWQWGWAHRFRVEGRFFEDNPNNGLRFRYLLRSQSQWNLSFQGVVWNEVFFNGIRHNPEEVLFFDRNRFFVGLRNRFYDVHVEWGYLNQYVHRSSSQRMEHLLVAYLFF